MKVLEFYQNKFAKQLETIVLYPNEDIKQCVDFDDPEFYMPAWAVTSQGRLWSIYRGTWVTPWSNHGELTFSRNSMSEEFGYSLNIKAHILVNHFFPSQSDEIIQQAADEMGFTTERHHKTRYSVPADFNSWNKSKKIKYNMMVNHADNICLQIAENHKETTSFSQGTHADLIQDPLFQEASKQMRKNKRNNAWYDDSVWVEYTLAEDGKTVQERPHVRVKKNPVPLTTELQIELYIVRLSISQYPKVKIKIS